MRPKRQCNVSACVSFVADFLQTVCSLRLRIQIRAKGYGKITSLTKKFLSCSKKGLKQKCSFKEARKHRHHSNITNLFDRFSFLFIQGTLVSRVETNYRMIFFLQFSLHKNQIRFWPLKEYISCSVIASLLKMFGDTTVVNCCSKSGLLFTHLNSRNDDCTMALNF